MFGKAFFGKVRKCYGLSGAFTKGAQRPYAGL